MTPSSVEEPAAHRPSTDSGARAYEGERCLHHRRPLVARSELGDGIVNGSVYWGSGYRNIPPGIGNNKVYAFTVAGSNDQGDDSDDQREQD